MVFEGNFLLNAQLFFVCFAGFVIYFSYGMNHSHVGLGIDESAAHTKIVNTNEHNREVYKEITKF